MPTGPSVPICFDDTSDSPGLRARSVLYAMAGIMAVAAIVAFVGLRPGVQEEVEPSDQEMVVEALA